MIAAGLLATPVTILLLVNFFLLLVAGLHTSIKPIFTLRVNWLRMFFPNLVILPCLSLSLTITKWPGAAMVLRGFDMNDFYNGFAEYRRIFCGSFRCAWYWFAFHYFRNNTLRVISYEH